MTEKDPAKVKQGKSNRKAGKKFEKEVEKDLESKGWIVVKFNKQVELVRSTNADGKDERVEAGKLITAKGQFNPFFRRIVGEGSGFPDFVCFQYGPHAFNGGGYEWKVQLVESKMTGKLDKIEKEKCKWIIENLNIPIFIASQDYPDENINLPPSKRKKKQIKYEEFKPKDL